MLSQGAFNAFLKTLEEPPSYCKFILATTEKHKILPTILSRCQIFDFRRISIEVIVAHLRHICQLEHIVAEEDALHIIAQKSDGGMRDSLSMFDRLSSFAGGRLTYASVLENLNVLDYDYFFKVTDALLTEDMNALMGYLSEVLKRGFEGDDFVLGLCAHFRNLLFAKNLDTLKLMEVSETLKKRYLDQTNLTSSSFLVNCLSIGNQCDVNYKQAKNKRLSVEIALIKMCYVNSTVEAAVEASKKKLNTSVAEVKTATPAVENKQVQPPQAETTAASTRPAAVAPRPVPDKDNALKKSPKLLSLENIHEVAQQKQKATNNAEEEDREIVMAAVVRLYDQETVLDIWNEFARDIKEAKGGVSSLMGSFTPVATPDGVITITVESEIQRNHFASIIVSLRNKIYSYTTVKPDIQLIVSKNMEANPKFYTPKDKMKLLLEINPAIRRFQKELDLDLDYD